MSTADAIDRAGRAAASALSWAWRETAGLLPDALACAGTAGRAALVELDADGAPGAASGAARSLLGRWRHDGRAGRGEAIILINRDRVLRRTLHLSPLAARDPVAAARLQAATLSPIRPEDAVFAVEAVGPERVGEGVIVDLAIVRRADVETARALAGGRARRWCVAGDFGAGGARFVFARGVPDRAANPALMVMLAGLAVLAALTALDVRLARDAEALRDQRDGLLAQVRTARQMASGREDGDTPSGRAASYPLLADILTETAEIDAESLVRVRAVGRRVIFETRDGRVIETEAGGP